MTHVPKFQSKSEPKVNVLNTDLRKEIQNLIRPPSTKHFTSKICYQLNIANEMHQRIFQRVYAKQ
jgi:hypothetical protein